MPIRENLINIWNTIDSEDQGGKKVWREFPSENNTIRIGKINPEGYLVVGFVFNENLKVSPTSFAKSKSFEIFLYRSEIDENPVLEVKLIEPSLKNGFTYFVSDLIESIENKTNQQEILSILRYKIYDWFKLFSKLGNKRLSKENEIGLFGELTCLDEYFFQMKDKFNALNLWTGPFSSLHDFTATNFSIEVKSTTQDEQINIKISNTAQLDNNRVKKLYLAVQKLQLNNNGLTLPSLIDNLKTKINNMPDARRLFEECIEAYGYSDKFRDEYEDFFLKEYTSFYLVTEDFPKIINRDLSFGIHDVEYKIDINSIEKFIINNTKIESEISNI